MTPADQVLQAIADGHGLLAREREMLDSGDYAGMAGLVAEKQALLDRLEQLIRQVRGTAGLRAALTALIEDSRRNELLIQAARQGVVGARRRIETILATKRGAVAYDRDGAPISSREDSVSESSRA